MAPYGNCKKHGGVGFLTMCNHVFEKLNAGQFPTLINFQSFVYSFKVCTECYASDQLSQLDGITIDEWLLKPQMEAELMEKRLAEIEKKYHYFYCYKCYNEIKIKQTNSGLI
jgi:hypothetical protein